MASETDSTPSSSRGSLAPATTTLPLLQTYMTTGSSGRHFVQTTASPTSPMSPGSYEKETRKISSVIISEEFVERARDLEARTIEREVIEERVIRVPKKETVYVERRVPKVEIKYEDKIVEFDQVVYKDKVVEVPEYQEVVVFKPKIEMVDREVEHIIRNPVITVLKREQQVQVPGKIIEVPKHYKVEQKVDVPRYVDGDVPVIIAQTVKPILVETAEAMDVDVLEYEPEVVAVDIHVAKAVDANLIASGAVSQIHRVVTVPAGQYNMLMRQLNTHLDDKEIASLPFMQENNQIPFLRDAVVFEVAKTPLKIEGYNTKVTSRQGSSVHPLYHQSRNASMAESSDRQSTFKSSPKGSKPQQPGCCAGPSHAASKPVQYRAVTSSVSSASLSDLHTSHHQQSQPRPHNAPTINSELGTARTLSTNQARALTGHTTQSGRRSLPSSVGKNKSGCC